MVRCRKGDCEKGKEERCLEGLSAVVLSTLAQWKLHYTWGRCIAVGIHEEASEAKQEKCKVEIKGFKKLVGDNWGRLLLKHTTKENALI